MYKMECDKSEVNSLTPGNQNFIIDIFITIA